ncbi:hypothetical protein BDV93DRAFT_512199 [Ceratobasidium sp. AG-I]|nr:hypothetical protein BDV93DRAFT_512199 [Ceratobasidium sp. AG-I]
MAHARRVAGIPELIVSVAISLSDRYPLLFVSKHFFRTVAPLIWKSVPRADILLHLIPGTSECSKISRPSCWATVSFIIGKGITLPSTLDLTRFDLYAPWVQRLEVFGGEYEHSLHNADALFHTSSTRHLLPNLRVLTISARAETSLYECLSFTALFLSPTLVEIRHARQGKDPRYLKIRPALWLVQKILGVCPNVEMLEFYPGQESGGNSSLEGNMVFSLPGVSMHATLAGFSYLRSFTSTIYIFESAMLQVLGNLPLLESLDVFDCAEHPTSLDGGFTIPETWFPALRHLHLRNFDAKDVSAVWGQPFVRNLVSATIKCDPATVHEKFYTTPGGVWINTFLTKLPQASPQLSNLDLDLEAVPSLHQGAYLLFRAGVDALRQLPLRSVRLNYLSTSWENLVRAFPGAEEFYTIGGHIPVNPEQLRVFATHMPRLRLLMVNVHWATPLEPSGASRQHTELPLDLAPHPPVVLISRSSMTDLHTPLDQLRKIAKFLSEIWPGGFRVEAYPGMRKLEDHANSKNRNLLNELVSEFLVEAAAVT